MSDYSSDEENDRRRHRRHTKPKYKAMDYITEVNKGADTLINSVFFKMAHDWVTRNAGVDLKHVVFGLCLFAASRTYSKQAMKWLEENGTNTVMIRSNENLAQDLELWVGRQPSNQQTFRFLCSLPSFQNLEWKRVASDQEDTQDQSGSWGRSSSGNSSSRNTDEAEGYSGYEFVASTGRSLFVFQGKLFALEKGEYDNLKLRCFWGNAKPIQALIRHVQMTAKDRSGSVQVHMIRGTPGSNTTVTNKRRSINSIDIAPREKQDILTDLQDFFDPETEDWCMENGAPYRKGFMFYGPPGTGKSSLCTAIASEFHLPIYFIHLDGMDDKTLHEQFQILPKRCMVLFEEIDTAGIVRQSTMKEVPKDTPSDKAPETESEEPGSSNQSSRTGKGKEAPKPQRSKVTLGGLLNVLDGPGAKEGRLVIFTTNSPNSLDKALIRPGRIDRKVYLGRSTKLVASITFSRIFGTDPRLKGKIRKSDLDRMAKEFGDLVPANTFTPCEIQSYCMSKRGKPEEAVKKFPEWIEEQRRDGNAFKYDITENPNGTDEEEEQDETWDQLVSSTADDSDVVETSSSTSTTPTTDQLHETQHELNRETLELEDLHKGKGSASDSTESNDSHSLRDNVPMAISPRVDLSDTNSESSSTGNSNKSDKFYSAPASPSGSSALQWVSNYSHPFFVGVRNVYSHDKALGNDDQILDDGRTVLLRTVDPIPEDILVLHHGEEEDEEEGFNAEFSVWSVGMF